MQPLESGDESVYDDYLAASASGRAESPEAVFARNPGLSEEVRGRIEAIWLATALRTVEVPLRMPTRLGAYRLVERVDSGGMGTVFRATREPDGGEVAVKVLRPELAGSVIATERLRREAMALSRLRHPNVVRVHGLGEDAGTTYLVLELVPGRSLDEILAEAATRGELLPVERVVRWGIALARGLAAAHAEGVIHRDVKPSNVRIRPDDTPVLLDFGIATVPERTPGALTTTFAGSPFYAAPEQIVGTQSDGRTDVYALCVTLYQCLVGRVPFAGDRFDAVLRRVLTETPVPVRRLAPHVPRDLETVVLAGLEKDAARRPPSSTALAYDLEAALRGGRIRSRRPGPFRVVARAARQRPFAAASIALAVVVAAGAAGLVAWSHRAERERVRDEAESALREAIHRTDTYVAEGAREEEFARSVQNRTLRSGEKWFPDVELAKLDEDEERCMRLRRERDTSFHAILALLDRAERLVPGVEGVDACRARLYVSRWREATAAGDVTAAAFYETMVERADPGGPSAREVSGSAEISISTDPPDAEVHIFRATIRSDLVPGGGRRFVPVPLRGWPPELPPAPWALRVVRGTADVPEGAHVLSVAGQPVEECVFAQTADPPLAPLDRLLEIGGVAVRDVHDAHRLGAPGPERHFVFARGSERLVRSAASLAALGVSPVSAADVARDGDVHATLWIDGAVRELRLPSGLDVRETAAPMLAGAASRLTREEAASLRLPPDDYTVLVRHPGRLDTRVVFELQPPGAILEFHVRLPLPAERPVGCALVPECVLPPGHGPMWLQEREVTAGEYLEFLNDPTTRSTIDGSARVIRVPRHEVDPPLWPRGDDGLFRLPAETPHDHPVLGVSFEDATAYAAWRTRRAGERSEPWTFRLPTFAEWVWAAAATTKRTYTFGARFRPRWASTCYSRPTPQPEPVLSYPVDESPYCIYDLCGSAMEWADEWYDEPRGLRRIAGGSWAQGIHEAMHSYVARGKRPDRADREFGFRLVVEPAERRPR